MSTTSPVPPPFPPVPPANPPIESSNILIGMNKKPGPITKFLQLLIFSLALAFIGFASFTIYQTRQEKQTNPTPVVYQNPSPTPNLNPNPASAISAIPADWKTYKNEDYGFEIDYPDSQWQITREEQNKPVFKLLVEFTPKEKLSTLKNFVIEIKQENYANYLSELRKTVNQYNGNINTTSLNQVNAQKATYLTGINNEDYVMLIFFEHQNNTFVIYPTLSNPPDKKELSVFDQILSTFKFTN